jgi:ubiquinone/menaquinone biosynthesis C-methylase UbiE
MPEWFEDESLWIETYPLMFSEQRFEMAEEEINKIIALVDFQGTSVLDLCCGPGRHAVILAKKGYSVTAVDRTRFLLWKRNDTP